MASTHPRTFVGKVKADAVSFEPIEDVLEQIRRKRSPDWAVFGFADQHASRNTLKVLAIGDGDLSDRSQWPPELFAPNSLCYGFMRFEFSEEETFAPVFISFCWKGRSLPIYLRTKYAEFNHVIRKHLKATNHMTLQHPDELAEGTFWQNMPPTPRRKRSHSRRFVTNDIEFTPEVLQVVKDIRSDAAPYNWMVCGYDTSDSDIGVQKIAVIDKGMAGLHALKGLGGITATLKEGATMYIYLRVDIPIHHNAERIVPKFVLVTWQGVDNGLFSDDESGEGWNSLSFSDGPPLSGPPLSSSSLRDTLPPTPSNSIVQRVMTAQKHGSEVTRFFPHHVHFSANSLSEITEETIRERVRRAVDNDCMLLRVVCIQRTGETQSPICVEVPFDATVALLRKEIASFVGIPEQQQQIVWIRQMDDFVNEFQRSTRAIVFNDNDAMLRTDIGLGHGDKIYVGDNADGEESILDKLVKQINSGTVNVSLSAERRHEVQQGVEAREAELQKILSATHDLLRKRVGSNAQLRPVTTRLSATQASEAVVPEPVVALREVEEPGSNGDCVQQNGSTSPHSYASEDVSNLQEKARVLEEQNEYLEIPKESIRILGGKENELGCGKAATVYRGLWLNKNGAAEVAIKLFRYVRLTDKILGDYTTEVALLRKLKHPNIVLFIGACTDSKLMILTEYCSRKSLYEVIHTPNFATIPWQYKVRMMLDAARGIQYLHSRRIIHRDIKSHNFLVDDDWRVKVADFGISKILENDSTAYTQCGTTGWVAPEVLLDEDVGYTFKADNWSFAVVMWEMVADGLQNQFIGMAPIKFYNQTIHAGIRPPFPDGVDPEYVALINECWHSNASDRPPFAEIVARLEQMVLRLGGSIDLPPTYQGGYHHLTNAD